MLRILKNLACPLRGLNHQALTFEPLILSVPHLKLPANRRVNHHTTAAAVARRGKMTAAHALIERSFSSQIVAVQTTVCLFVQKIAFCMFGSIAVGYGCFCRTSRILSDYFRRVFHNPGIFYSDNRILKELALSCLPNVNLYGTTTCPSFRMSAGQHKIIQY